MKTTKTVIKLFDNILKTINMKYPTVINYLAILVLMASCSKVELKASDEKMTYRFNEGLAYINLPLNKSYMYIDSASRSTCYVKVTESTVDINYVSPTYFWESGYYFETYMLQLSNITGATTETWFLGHAKCYNNVGFYGSGVDNSSFSFYDGQAGTTCFYYPFVTDSSGKYKYIPSMSIEGKIYKDIYRFTSNNRLNPTDANYQMLSYYWVKGIGIIKKQTITNTSKQTFYLVQY